MRTYIKMNLSEKHQYITTPEFAVFIGSHISSVKRIAFLSETINSLIKQTKPAGIYISISFENKDLEEIFKKNIMRSPLVNTFSSFYSFYYFIRDEKTPQMKHLEFICSQLRRTIYHPLPQWILFSDDDDTHVEDRVERFAKQIELCEADLNKAVMDPDRLVGLYESHDFGINHKHQRHEYWCYCVRFSLLCEFFKKLEPYPDVIENKCCDIVFGEFLRRRKSSDLFSYIDAKMYNYRRENNTDSVTGRIISKTDVKLRTPNPPSMDCNEIVDYIMEFNDYLHENIEIYMHDTFLRTVVGSQFDDILRAEFLADYALLNYVDVCHKDKLRVYHEHLRAVCLAVYDEGFPPSK